MIWEVRLPKLLSTIALPEQPTSQARVRLTT